MAEYTNNINLEKPLGNENFRRQVINDNMEKIDKRFGVGTEEGHTHDGTAGQGNRISYSNLTDKPAALAPTAHKSIHSAGGSDALTCADIGAAAQADFSAYKAESIYLQEEEPTATHSKTVWFDIKSEINFSEGGVSIGNAETSVTPPGTQYWFQPVI